eukprot:40224-Eustigmatos_ZCMA.PRE.1
MRPLILNVLDWCCLSSLSELDHAWNIGEEDLHPRRSRANCRKGGGSLARGNPDPSRGNPDPSRASHE